MSTRKVKDAIDLETNENIYFKGHAKATYMSDGKTVEEAINSIGEGGSVSYPLVEHGNDDTLVTLEIVPNVFHVWDEVGFLDLSLGEEIEGVVNEYVFQFTSGATPTILTLPDTIQWVNGAPSIEANKTYQVSIVNNIGLIVSV